MIKIATELTQRYSSNPFVVQGSVSWDYEEDLSGSEKAYKLRITYDIEVPHTAEPGTRYTSSTSVDISSNIRPIPVTEVGTGAQPPRQAQSLKSVTAQYADFKQTDHNWCWNKSESSIFDPKVTLDGIKWLVLGSARCSMKVLHGMV